MDVFAVLHVWRYKHQNFDTSHKKNYILYTEDWDQDVPPIGQNPTCKCNCVCGFQRYKEKRLQYTKELADAKS